MNNRYSLLLLIFMLFPVFIFAQNGRIAGVIKDQDTNSPLAGVSVSIVGSTNAISSDFEGDYALDITPGTYTVLFSYIGYQSTQITEVKVEPEKSTTIDVILTPSADQLEEVVVSVSARKNTEQSILNMQKNSGVVMDGLSSQAIKRSGASNIATAVRVVPGVSVQDGKYLYVRGLGDRYTKSILNGVDIPGLDPDKNTVQMDIFPTGVLENIVVMKTASAELPADFTGGVVDIVTKDIPSQKQIGVSFSLGYNPAMHFKDNYVGYSGSGTDYLGFDNGNRKLPIDAGYDIPSPTNSSNRETLESVTRSFNPLMGATRRTSLPDLSLGFDFSNQYDVWGNKLGVIGLLNYKKTTTFYEGYQNGIFQKPNQNDPSSELRADRTSVGDLGSEDVLLSGMLGLNYKTGRSKYTLNLLHIQNGESRGAIYNQTSRIANSNETYRQILDYSQRSISNILLSGKHSNENSDFITEWKVSPSLAKVRDKDVRQTTFVLDGNNNYIISTDAGLPVRIWRDLDEVNLVNKIDFTKKAQWFGRETSLKFGGLYSYKQRDYGINNYTINYRANDLSKPNGDPDAILNSENIYSAETNSGFYMQGQFEAANTFDAAQHTGAVYASAEFKPFERLRTIIGLRGEQYTSFFTGQNIDRLKYDNQKTINKFDLFPSLNLIYSPITNQNLRASYSRTTARPSFKELSVVQIYDPLTDTRFLGNIDLKPTYINNADIRYEIFGEQSQMIAISAFYKNFKDPIELQAYSDEAPDNITPRNAPSANVFGFEVEARKNFGFISEGLKDLSLNANASFVKSEIDMGENEYDSRMSFAREGEVISKTRELQGQSPYLINAGLNYNNLNNGFEIGAFYNVQGKTLEIIGFSKNSDVYSKPFNSLNLNVAKKLGADLKGGTISFKVDNMLDSKRISVYEAFGAADQIYQSRKPRRTFSVGYSYNF
ncbi:TonB-dependent receptor [Sphingobacterium shayense]|uniref:TonB-dependent receptor n=1 Tax=Sphingobacterium shayense TaxID=626343 RepID=UPI0015543786|nr:TonB-dependent receptor [Sphingobacterium shayense]NQD71550.1 TonB-dependent receptor [Sphingobacterium shayense]